MHEKNLTYFKDSSIFKLLKIFNCEIKGVFIPQVTDIWYFSLQELISNKLNQFCTLL